MAPLKPNSAATAFQCRSPSTPLILAITILLIHGYGLCAGIYGDLDSRPNINHQEFNDNAKMQLDVDGSASKFRVWASLLRVSTIHEHSDFDRIPISGNFCPSHDPLTRIVWAGRQLVNGGGMRLGTSAHKRIGLGSFESNRCALLECGGETVPAAGLIMKQVKSGAARLVSKSLGAGEIRVDGDTLGVQINSVAGCLVVLGDWRFFGSDPLPHETDGVIAGDDNVEDCGSNVAALVRLSLDLIWLGQTIGPMLVALGNGLLCVTMGQKRKMKEASTRPGLFIKESSKPIRAFRSLDSSGARFTMLLGLVSLWNEK